MVKLIASDLDGTLLHYGGLSEYSARVLKKLNEKGLPFVVATGRDLDGMKSFFSPYGIKYSAILGNGAQYYNEQGQLLKAHYIDLKLFKPICDLLDQFSLPYMIFCTDGFYCTGDPASIMEDFIVRGMVRFHKTREEQTLRVQGMPCTKLKKIEDKDAFIKEGHQIIKFEAFSLDESLIDKTKDKLSEISGITYLSSFSDNVEITDEHAQKGLILKEVIQEMGIALDEVAVFGDGMNDLSLFETFPYSYAPLNADETIKQMAYEVIDDCVNDSVAKKIETFI